MNAVRRLWQRPTPPVAPLFDPDFARRLERLALRSRQVLTWRAVGEHRSPRRAPSREFVDFRPYTPGEDPRYVDWNTYARLGELVTRLGEVSTDLTVHVMLDVSASMDWGEPNKLWYAKRLAAALGYIALWHFDRVVVVPFDTGPREPFGPRRGRPALVALFDYLERLPVGAETELERSLRVYARRARRPGVLLVVSDCLSTTGETLAASALQPFLARDWEVIVFQVLDAREVEPDYAGNLRLEDVEGDATLRVAPDDETLARYRGALDRWLGGLETHCHAYRVGYLRLLTAWPFETMLLRFLQDKGIAGLHGGRSGLVVRA